MILTPHGYDVFYGPGPEAQWEFTAVVLARSDELIFFKDLSKPLQWPKLNRMRAMRLDDLIWLESAGYWREVSIQLKHPRYLIEAATKVWLIKAGLGYLLDQAP